MPKVINDIVLENQLELVRTDGLYRVGETAWAQWGEEYVLVEIKKIRWDSSIRMSRYYVSAAKYYWWTNWLLTEEEVQQYRLYGNEAF